MHPALEQVDWEREAGRWWSCWRRCRFDTTNPPGNEAEAVAFLADTLRQAGVEPEVLSAPGRANLVASLPGAAGTRPRCCSTATSTWSRPRPDAGGTHRSRARSTTASSGAGARST